MITVGVTILALIGIGFYVLSTKGRNLATKTIPSSSISPALTISPTVSPSQTSQQVVSAFYESYETCVKNPPPEAKGRVSVYCQNNTGLTSNNFGQNIEAGGTAKAGADPIVCAQDFPQDINVGNATQGTDDTATVSVSESFGTAKIEIPVTLKIENGQWMIDNIVCPKP